MFLEVWRWFRKSASEENGHSILLWHPGTMLCTILAKEEISALWFDFFHFKPVEGNAKLKADIFIDMLHGFGTPYFIYSPLYRFPKS